MSELKMKICRKCHLEKPETEFTITDAQKRWRRSWCKACENKRIRAYYASNPEYREKVRERTAARNLIVKRTPEQSRKNLLKGKYGLVQEQYDQLLKDQDGKCALCRTDNPGKFGTKGWQGTGVWPVDHCHESGAVRGLLCHHCNTRLGAYEGLMKQVGEARILDYLTRPCPVIPLPSEPVPEYVRHEELPPIYTPSPPCVVAGCEETSKANGLCDAHYARWLRRDRPEISTVATTNRVKGADHKLSKLTEDDVQYIRSSAETGVSLAARFGVSATLISNVRKGKVWCHADAGQSEYQGKPRVMTEQDVRDIRASTERGCDLAERYGVTRASICDIQKRRSWKHLE